MQLSLFWSTFAQIYQNNTCFYLFMNILYTSIPDYLLL